LTEGQKYSNTASSFSFGAMVDKVPSNIIAEEKVESETNQRHSKQKWGVHRGGIRNQPATQQTEVGCAS